MNDGATMLYRASKHDCTDCALTVRCCPKDLVRKVSRSIYEGARDMAREIVRTWEGSRRLRKKIEMLFAHLKRILKLAPLRLRGPNGARDEFTLAATAQNLRKMAKLIAMPVARAATAAFSVAASTGPVIRIRAAAANSISIDPPLLAARLDKAPALIPRSPLQVRSQAGRHPSARPKRAPPSQEQ